MSINIRQCLILVIISTGLFSCVNEKTLEKQIVPERQAPNSIDDSLTIKTQNNQIGHYTLELKKSELKKAFLLMPILKSTGKNPDVNLAHTQVVSFERHGQKVGLYNLTTTQLYSSIDSNILLQTFQIVSENESTLSLDLDRGFTSISSRDNLGILVKELVQVEFEKINSGMDSAFNVKDSVIKNVTKLDNSYYIQQGVRISGSSLAKKKNPFEEASSKSAQAELTLEEKEVSFNIEFELSPYIENKNFVPKTFDKKMNYGYFINFATEIGQDLPVPYIAKWDFSQQRQPITVRLQNNTPEQAKKSLIDGILYWNKVFGRQVISMGPEFSSSEPQPSRTIFVYWIPWDTAGYARAGLQTNPITGEILKGQVFMTSSWMLIGKNGLRSFDKKTNTQSNLSTSISGSICQLNQADVVDALSTSNHLKLSDQVTLDTLRIVLAHEIGHTLGLRHNFAGSASTNFTDQDLAKFKVDYIENQLSDSATNSTTVMDYTIGLDTAINGRFIKNNVLPYDKAAIEWGYNSTAQSPETNYKYCSDEHIMFANYVEKSIPGCNRFDVGQNPFANLTETIKLNTKYKTEMIFEMLLSLSANKTTYYTKDTKYPLEAYLQYLVNFENLTQNISSDKIDFMYKKSYIDSFVNLSFIIDSSLNLLNGYQLESDSQASTYFINKSKEIGGLSQIYKELMSLQNSESNLFSKQVERFFATHQYSDYSDVLSEAQFNAIKATMIESSQKADSRYLISVVTSLPLKKAINETVSGSSVSQEKVISELIDFGDLNYISELFLKAYAQSLSQTKLPRIINGVQVDLRMYPFNNIVGSLKSFFAPTNYSVFLKNPTLATQTINAGKALAAQNVMDVLKVLGVDTSKLNPTSKSLEQAILAINWDQVKGINQGELFLDLNELKKWETE
ncbi:MAG: zinc-dependent metalloprotease [Pseudobdellovibrio sp.]